MTQNNPQVKLFLIPQPFVQALVDNLKKRPLEEVFDLVQGLLRLQVAQVVQPEDEAKAPAGPPRMTPISPIPHEEPHHD